MDEASDAGVESAPRTVTRRRTFPIRRDRLFALWTDPRHLSMWWGPSGWRVTRCELELRKGGSWRTWLRTTSGVEVEVGGEYLTIRRPDHLAFTWEIVDDPGAEPHITVVRVDFIDQGASTELVLEHRKLSNDRAVDMDVGWSNTFDSLARFIEESPLTD
ncbi:MAG: activator of ATPase [Gammaproteobacteria bacterium]|nr:activator of ATPase [Gammaproteobacteria bacterium]